MGTGAVTTTPLERLDASSIDGRHPLCRGEFAAIVFSGDVELIGDLAGEPTAHVPLKYAMKDPTMNGARDFAGMPGMMLPEWRHQTTKPTDGVCFVFTSPDHPVLAALRQAGGLKDEHFVLLGTGVNPAADDLHRRLDQFVRAIPRHGAIIILGYGHQGSEIAARLVTDFEITRDRIRIHESSADALACAQAHQFALLHDHAAPWPADGVIYSPLMRYEGLHRMLEAAKSRGVPTLDNSRASLGLQQFVRRGRLRLESAANRSLRIHGNLISRNIPGVAIRVSGICEDQCGVGGSSFAHLHGGDWFQLDDERPSISLDAWGTRNRLAACTVIGSDRVFLAIRDRADLGFFAARELGVRLWPGATESVFPSEHFIELGRTAFERLLQGHMDAREVVSTMQTPSQRAMLGIVAGQFASNRPIVEIGSAFGGSALLMAAATDRGRPPIHSIDPEASTRDIMRFAFQREGHLDRLNQIVLPSDQAIEQLRHLRGQCGLVFIDGLHTFDGVESDFNLYAPLVASGGALLFHDVAPAIEPVMRFVLGRVAADPRFRLKCLVDGLAVLERA